MFLYCSTSFLLWDKDCRTQDQECTCPELTSDCRCGLNGRCLSDGSCHAAECATLGLRECSCVKKSKRPLSRRLFQGSLTGAPMCSICCEMQVKGGRTECIPVQVAVRERQAINAALPDDWPDPDYIGPNLTIRLCRGYECHDTWMRAWPPGSVCVSQNIVGICTPFGVCKRDHIMPRSNVYPNIMNRHLTGAKKSARSIKPASNIFISCLVLLCLIK